MGPKSALFIIMASSRVSSGTEEYEIVKQLGSGAFGSVTKVIRRSDRKAFAMKTVQIGKMEEREVADALNECRILASIRHPRIVNFEVRQCCPFGQRGARRRRTEFHSPFWPRPR